MQARKRLAEHEAEMGDLRSEFQEFLQADEGKLTQMARLLASIQDLQQERDSLKSQLTEAHSSSEVKSTHVRPTLPSRVHALQGHAFLQGLSRSRSPLCAPNLPSTYDINDGSLVVGHSISKGFPNSLSSKARRVLVRWSCPAKAACGFQDLSQMGNRWFFDLA